VSHIIYLKGLEGPPLFYFIFEFIIKHNMTDHHDEDTTALFDEIEKEKKGDYQTCSASQTFDAVWQCYSK
jgi:hypothetical protein